jgi:hypothetical protein
LRPPRTSVSINGQTGFASHLDPRNSTLPEDYSAVTVHYSTADHTYSGQGHGNGLHVPRKPSAETFEAAPNATLAGRNGSLCLVTRMRRLATGARAPTSLKLHEEKGDCDRKGTMRNRGRGSRNLPTETNTPTLPRLNSSTMTRESMAYNGKSWKRSTDRLIAINHLARVRSVQLAPVSAVASDPAHISLTN